MGALPDEVMQPHAYLLDEYVGKGMPVNKGLSWSPQVLATSIYQGTHELECTPKMNDLIYREIKEQAQTGLSILLLIDYAVQAFREYLKFSCIIVVHQ